MRNWLGQDILPGSVVYRGARRGNSSEYKVGVVESLGGNGTARVQYKYEAGYAYRATVSGAEYARNVPMEINSKGSPALNSLILLSDSDLARLDQAMYWVNRWKADPTMSEADLKGTLDTLI